MNLVLDEVVGPTKELGREEDDRGRTVADLLVLLLSKRDEDATLERSDRRPIQPQSASYLNSALSDSQLGE